MIDIHLFLILIGNSLPFFFREGQFCIGMVGLRIISGWQDSPEAQTEEEDKRNCGEGKGGGWRWREELPLTCENTESVPHHGGLRAGAAL